MLPNSPREIPLRQFSQRQAGNAVRILLQSPVQSTTARVIGINIKVSSQGTAEQVALATSRQVVVISLEALRMPVSDALFQGLLAGGVLRYDPDPASVQETLLVGFHIARTALHLHHVLKKHIRAIDLSSLFSPPNSQPAEIFSRLFHRAKQGQAIPLWAGHTDANTLAMQAWMSAESVQI